MTLIDDSEFAHLIGVTLASLEILQDGFAVRRRSCRRPFRTTEEAAAFTRALSAAPAFRDYVTLLLGAPINQKVDAPEGICSQYCT